MSFRGKTVSSFLDILSSKAPSPGGGSAAALTGALGCALIEMAASINGSKTDEVRALRRRMEALMDLDAARFSKLSALYKRKEKGQALEAALKGCAEPPLKICEGAFQAAGMAKNEWPKTGRWLRSDLVEANLLLKAAFQSGELNAEANLTLIKDKNFVTGARKKIASWKKTWPKLPLR